MTLTWNGVEPQRERWIIVATAAFVLLSVVMLHLVSAYNRAHPEPLFDGARRGAMMQITLNDSICDELHLGELVCGRSYLARYNKRTNKWTVRGPTIHTPAYDSTATFPDVDNHPGSISIWGFPATFDSEGTLTIAPRKIGTVQFAVGNWKPMHDAP
jgi:hypothetical protein